MILVDTSIWIDHLQRSNPSLKKLLQDGSLLCHAMVIGELAVGNFKQRQVILSQLGALPRAVAASHEEVLQFIACHSLFGRGIGYIDAHLLAAVKLTRGCTLWTGDKRLREIAETLHLEFRPLPQAGLA